MRLFSRLARLFARADDLPPQGDAPIRPGSTTIGARAGGALAYPASLRAVEIVSTTTARAIIETLYEADEYGNRIETEDSQAMTAVMRNSLDGGRTAALTTWTDTTADVCRYGNAYLQPIRAGSGRLVRMRRFDAASAQWDQGRGRYWLREANNPYGPLVSFSVGDIVHIRWGMTVPGQPGNFSENPMQRIADQVAIGKLADEWMDSELARDPGSGIIVAVEKPQEPGNTKGDEKRQKAITQYRSFTRRLAPWVFEGRGAVNVREVRRRAADAAVVETRRLQMAVVCSVFGVPPSKMGIGEPASVAMEEQAFWKDGIAPMVSRILEPLSTRLLMRKRRFQVDPIHLLRDASNLPEVVNALRPNTGVQPIVPVSYIRRRVGISLTQSEMDELEDQEAERKKRAEAMPMPPPAPGQPVPDPPDSADSEEPAPEQDDAAVAAALDRLQSDPAVADAIYAMASQADERITR